MRRLAVPAQAMKPTGARAAWYAARCILLLPRGRLSTGPCRQPCVRNKCSAVEQEDTKHTVQLYTTGEDSLGITSACTTIGGSAPPTATLLEIGKLIHSRCSHVKTHALRRLAQCWGLLCKLLGVPKSMTIHRVESTCWLFVISVLLQEAQSGMASVMSSA